ncbi:MAG: hypothetical protein ACP5GJ_03200 [Nanopusillaceae archaeon]|jgi:uncharacterized integral membrane protein
MKSQTMGKGSALILSIILIVIILVAYSVLVYHNFFGAFYEFISLFQQYPLNEIIILLAGFLIGYFQGKAF